MASSKRVAVCTGCSEGGMGYFFAKELAARGYTTYATARKAAKMAGLEEAGCKLLEMDVNDQASVDAARDRIIKEVGTDVHFTIVNNAGVGHRKPVLDVDIEAAKKCYDTNVWGGIRVIQAFSKPMVAAKQGTIINVTSVVAFAGLPWQSIYNSSKAAFNSITDALRVELSPFGIKVVNVVPGGVNTNITNNQSDIVTAKLPAGSPYAASWDKVKNLQAARVAAGPDPEAFAREVISRATKSSPIWAGAQNGQVRFLSKLPSFIADRILYKAYHVDLVKSS